MNGKIYMAVPFAEKDNAKALGAKWDATLKKWYYEGPVYNYVKFAKWIACGREETTIACGYIYILESIQICFRCKKPTRVVGLGIGEHVMLFMGEDGHYEIEVAEDMAEYDEAIHVAWANDEHAIPKALLEYLQQNYNVHKGFSRTAGECFANHCDNCGVIQGNFFLFGEDSPLTALIPDGSQLQEKFQKIKIFSIGIDEDLVLDWDFSYCDNDCLYFKYGQTKDLRLLPSQYDDTITYKELYGI